MKGGHVSKLFGAAAGLGLVLFAFGCASVSEQSHAYLSSPRVPASNPDRVAILPKEPAQPKYLLGEVRLSVDGEPSRDEIEHKLKTGAAKLGADAVYIVYDRLHIFPVIYAGWYGPSGVSEYTRRDILGVAVKFK